MGHFNSLRHLRLAQLLHVVVADGIHDTAGGHQLDPVGAVFDVAADYAVDVFDGVGNVRLTRESKVRGEGVAVAVAAGERDAAAGRDDSGTANQPLSMLSRRANCPYPRSPSQASRMAVKPWSSQVCRLWTPQIAFCAEDMRRLPVEDWSLGLPRMWP